MEELRRLNRQLGRFLALLALGLSYTTALTLGLIVTLNAVEIAYRVFFRDSLTGLYETNLLLGTWVYFLGICPVYHRQGDITVDFLFNRLPLRLRRYAVAALHLITIGVLAVIFIYGGILIRQQLPFRTEGLGLPTLIYTLPLVISSAIVIVIALQQAVEILSPTNHHTINDA